MVSQIALPVAEKLYSPRAGKRCLVRDVPDVGHLNYEQKMPALLYLRSRSLSVSMHSESHRDPQKRAAQ